MRKIRSTSSSGAAQLGVVDMPCANRVAPEVDALLVNWGRWLGSRSVGNTGSSLWRMAGRGSRSAGYSMATAVIVPIDRLQAAMVEATVCNPGFGPRMRCLLQAHYVRQWHPLRTCREMGLHQDAYEEWVWRASVYFANRWAQAHGDIQQNSFTAA